MSDTHEHYRSNEAIEAPFSLAHFFHVLRAYGPVIRLSMLVIITGYAIVAVTIFLLAPSQRVSTLSFRLEFDGAERGTYPNGTRFSSAEIISKPVLLRVFKQNDLERFTSFEKFSSSVVVLESNDAREALSRDYQARLSDPKLTPIDRERIQREYELKLASLSKSEYAIHFLDSRRSSSIPTVMAKKILHDILREWADLASRDQHVLEYRVAVLSPDVLSTTPLEQSNPIVATEVLRSRIQRVIFNIDDLRVLPSAELIRSKSGLSLLDIRIQLDDIVRFRLEPLTRHMAMANLDDRLDTIQFLETQLAVDQRHLDAQERIREAARNAMAMYMNGETGPGDEGSAAAGDLPRPRNVVGSETVMPQLSDSFIERLIQLTSSSTDHEYRQKLTERYREAAVSVVPIQRAVGYDKSVLELLSRSRGGNNITREAVDRQIDATRAEARQLVQTIHEIYHKISANLNPSTELMTVTGSPERHVERSVSVKTLALVGILLSLAALPLVIIICLLHHRVREEEVSEKLVTATQAAEAVG